MGVTCEAGAGVWWGARRGGVGGGRGPSEEGRKNGAWGGKTSGE